MDRFGRRLRASSARAPTTVLQCGEVWLRALHGTRHGEVGEAYIGLEARPSGGGGKFLVI